MPISAAAHLPLVTSTSYPALLSHLSSNYNAQKTAHWSVAIRVLRSSYEQQAGKQGAPSRPKLMYLVTLSEFPTETFVLVEDSERETRASIKSRINAQRQQDILMDGDVILDPAITTTSESPSDAIKAIKLSAKDTATRHTLFTASSMYQLLLTRLNLPPPLGAPSMGDGAQAQASAGPGAWLPRGSPIVIEGAAFDLPSATKYGVEQIAQSSNSEWRVRVGMMQGRNAGAIIEAEYLPLLRMQNPILVLSQLQTLFPGYLTDPSAQGLPSLSIHYPSTEQWEEVIPASNETWFDSVDRAKSSNDIGWTGKERGRRLAFMYITLLKSRGIL